MVKPFVKGEITMTLEQHIESSKRWLKKALEEGTINIMEYDIMMKNLTEKDGPYVCRCGVRKSTKPEIVKHCIDHGKDHTWRKEE